MADFPAPALLRSGVTGSHHQQAGLTRGQLICSLEFTSRLLDLQYASRVKAISSHAGFLCPVEGSSSLWGLVLSCSWLTGTAFILVIAA